MAGFTPQEIETTKLSRETQGQVVHPPDGVFKQMIGEKELKNNPVSLDDVANALAIFGANVNKLKGAANRKKPHRVVGGRCEIPRDFYPLNKFVTLTADVMFVRGFTFLVTYSRSIKFTTTEYIPTRTAGQLAKSLMKVVYGYAHGGFVVNLMLMDMESEKVNDELPLVEVNTTAARENVPEIERRIRTIKERVRAATSDFSFNPIPSV